MYYEIDDIILEVILPDGNKLIFRPFYTSEPEIVIDLYKYEHYARLYLEKGQTILDIGSHIGVFALKAAKIVGSSGRVLCFEPQPDNFELLLKNIEINNYKNIIAFKIAIFNKKGSARLYQSPSAIAHSIVFPRSKEWILVEMNTIDNILNNLNINKIDAIKIDAEGAELKVLKGAINTLEAFKPKVAVASYHTPTQVYEVLKFFRTIEYETIIDQVLASPYRAIQAMVPIVYGYPKE
ncbi:MAG TPA: FkbM family methyltransferase [Methanosarcinales archaeon]|nr:FkbM family methyltransferase [Methanosarcinales archaeon]